MFFVSLLNVRFCDCKVPQKTTFHSKGIIFIFSARLVQPSGVPYYNSCGICHFCFAPKQCQGLFRLKHSPSHYAYHALVLDLNTLPTVTKRLLVPSMVQSESLHWKVRCALLEQSKLRDSFPCHQVINPFIAYKKKRKKKEHDDSLDKFKAHLVAKGVPKNLVWISHTLSAMSSSITISASFSTGCYTGCKYCPIWHKSIIPLWISYGRNLYDLAREFQGVLTGRLVCSLLS